MDETTLVMMRTLARICPGIPYARHTTGLAAPLPCPEGLTHRATARPTTHTNGVVGAASHGHGTSSVRILAVLCSAGATSRVDSTSTEETKRATQTTISGASASPPTTNEANPLSSAKPLKRSRSTDSASETGSDSDVTRSPPFKARCLDDAPRTTDHADGDRDTEGQAPTYAPPAAKSGSLYLRVMYDETLLETLPLELFRERHPQVLIDYLLSVGCWA